MGHYIGRGDGGYEFTEVLGEETRIPGDWSALITGGYAIDDLVSAGLPADAALAFAADGLEPLEKWDLIEPYLEAARLTGYMRAVDLTTERLFGLRLARETCEEIDVRCRELRRPGYYRDVLVGVANVERCQVNSSTPTRSARPRCPSSSTRTSRSPGSSAALIRAPRS